jgi:hypothetical protein
MDLTLIKIFPSLRRGWQEYNSPLKAFLRQIFYEENLISLRENFIFLQEVRSNKLIINQHKEEVTWLTH